MYFSFGFEGRIWDLTVSVPDHCLSFYFPCQSDLLKQPKIALYHSNQEVFNLNDWLLSTDSLEQKDFLKRLEKKNTVKCG